MALPSYGSLPSPPREVNLYEDRAWGERSSDCYEKLELIGRGTYGEVYKAKDKETGEVVALKMFKMENEHDGFPLTSVREIKILKKLKHENIIGLREVVAARGRDAIDPKGSIYMVFDYMEHDLAGLLKRIGKIRVESHLKCYLKQMLEGLAHCHAQNVLHRDMKCANLLIDNNGTLKLADFGLSRSYDNVNNGQFTNRVVTLWYRPPEILLGATRYGPAVDMWSVGCIFAEMLIGTPLFAAEKEIDQAHCIFRFCGSPTEENWAHVSQLPHFQKFKRDKPFENRFRQNFGHPKYKHIDPLAIDLLERMLALDPAKRISAKEALESDYFKSKPLPCLPSELPRHQSSHDYKMKRKREREDGRDDDSTYKQWASNRRPPPPGGTEKSGSQNFNRRDNYVGRQANNGYKQRPPHGSTGLGNYSNGYSNQRAPPVRSGIPGHGLLGSHPEGMEMRKDVNSGLHNVSAFNNNKRSDNKALLTHAESDDYEERFFDDTN